MKHLFTISLCLIGFLLKAQEYVNKDYYLVDSLNLSSLKKNDRKLIDSCLNLYHNAVHDTSKTNAIDIIIYECWDENVWPKYNNWLNQFTQQQVESYSSPVIVQHFKEALARTINNIGYIYNTQGHIQEALSSYHKSLKIQKELDDKKGIANSLTNIGYIYKNKGDISRALEYYHKSLKIQEELKHKKGIANSFNNIGAIYKAQEDMTQALSYYNKSLHLREELNDKKGTANSLNNIGAIYKIQGDIANALKYFHKSLEIRQVINDKKGIATAFNNLGSIYKSQGRLAKFNDKKLESDSLLLLSLHYYNKSLLIKETLKDKRGISLALNNIGALKFDMENLGEAKEHGIRGLQIAQELGFPNLISHNADLLSKIAEREGNYQEALEMYQLFIQLRDSLKNEKNQKATIQQQAKYEYEKQKALDDADHEKQLLLQHKEKEKQQLITYATAVGLMLVLAFLAFVFNRLKVTRKQKEAIDAQKQEIEQTHDQLAVHHKEITDSINYAERIQRSFLATTELLESNLNNNPSPALPVGKGDHPEQHLLDENAEVLPFGKDLGRVGYFVFFKPKDVVSGDFYWAGTLQNGDFAIVNADSTGHGVPGAIMSILNTSSIEKAVDQGLTNPADIFNSTRKTIIERLKKDGSENGGKDGMDASIICFNADKTKMTYCAAQNPIWIIRPVTSSADEGSVSRSEKELSSSRYEQSSTRTDNVKIFESEASNLILFEIKPEKMPVGKHDNDHIPFVGGEFELQKGDQIYTLTDGYQDQFGGPKGKKFKPKQLKETLLNICDKPMKDQQIILETTFDIWKEYTEQVDDVCVIGVRV